MFHFIIILSTILTLGCESDKYYTPPAGVNYAKTYYVAVDGNDENEGSKEAPFKTINSALALTKPGDTVMLREGVYHQRITFPQSGLLNDRITLKSYPNERAKIDGTGIQTSGWMALVTIKGIRCITVEGIDICNFTNTAPNCDPQGISITGESRHITIKNCNIYGIKNTAPSFSGENYRSAHAIFVLGDADVPISNLVIEGCNIYDTQTGTSETLTLAGNVDGFEIRNNKVYDVENIGIIVAGGDNLHPSGNKATNYARNGVIADNIVYNNSHTRSPDVWGPTSYGAIGIYVCGGAGTIIERNIVYDCDRGIGLVSESDLYATKDCIVRNNFVYNCWRTGIYMGDYMGYTNGGTDNCQFINNTLLFNNKVLGAFGEIEGELRLTRNCTNNVVKNNIVYARPDDVFVHKYTTSGSNNIIDYNLYYTTGTPKWIWNDVEYTDFEAWKNACNGDANSTYGVDPLLVSISTPDMHIKPESPAKNTGVVISPEVNGETDIDGKPRIVDNKVSKGAQQ